MRRKKVRQRVTYPWDDMRIGEKFIFGKAIKTLFRAKEIAKRAGKRYGKQFDVDDLNQDGTFQCWRMEDDWKPEPWRPQYPWTELKVGQGFYFRPEVNEHSARAMASAAQKRYDRKFRVRKLWNGYKCERVADGYVPKSGPEPVYPWKTIKIGETFKFREGVSFRGAYNMASVAKKVHGKRFTVRITKDGFNCTRVG